MRRPRARHARAIRWPHVSRASTWYVELARAEGLEVERVEHNRHFKLYVRAPDGTPAVFAAPTSPSDWRGDKNKRAQLRKFAREHGAR